MADYVNMHVLLLYTQPASTQVEWSALHEEQCQLSCSQPTPRENSPPKSYDFLLLFPRKTSASFPSLCWPSSHARVLPTLSLARDWSFLSCCHLSPWSQVVLAGGRGFQSLSLLSWAARPCSHHGRKLLLETKSILRLFTKFCTDTLPLRWQI